MQPSDFVQKMMALWRKPNETANTQLAAEQYCDALKDFNPAQLDAGWEKLRNEHDRAAWPLISECRKAILQARGSNTSTPAIKSTDEHPDFANNSMQSDTARRARSEGWLLGLWDFANKHGRMPQAHEVGRLRDSSDRANNLATNLDTSQKINRLLHSWWSAMKDRERKLSALVPDSRPA